MVEAIEGRPRGQSGLAEMGEALLEAFEDDASEGIAGRDGATSARVAALEVDLTDAEADGATFFGAEELILPKCGNAVDLQRSAKAKSYIVNGEAGEPFANGLKGSGRDNGGTVCDRIVRKAVGRVANEDLLLEEDAEPFGGVLVGLGKDKRAGRDIATVAGDG